jgi:hypothetical protein
MVSHPEARTIMPRTVTERPWIGSDIAEIPAKASVCNVPSAAFLLALVLGQMVVDFLRPRGKMRNS